MALQLRPERAIVPIIRAARKRPISAILGSGFFVGTEDATYVVTAKHVFTGNPLADGERYGYVLRGEKGIAILAMHEVRASTQYDVAVGIAPEEHMEVAVRLPLAESEPGLNDDVLCFEYSSTRIERKMEGGTHVSFEPYAHKGNIVRSFESTNPEPVPTSSYLTSFPALQGASGAPLLVKTHPRRTLAVVGMMVANYERHLMPAQVVTIEHDDGEREEIRYFLPYGKALGRSILTSELERLGAAFERANIDPPDPDYGAA